jgi:hypothetical protein
MSYLKGDKAETWQSEYRKKLWSRDGDYRCTWDAYEEALIEHYLSPFGEQKAVQQMYDQRYTEDIEAYIYKLRYYNHKAKLTGGALNDAVMRGLKEEVIKAFSQMGRTRTDKELWEKLNQAGQGIEDAVRQSKYQSRSSSSGGSKSDFKKRGRSDNDQKNESSEKKKKTNDLGSTSGSSASSGVITVGDSEWSKKYAGIPRSLFDRRRRERKCTVCEDSKH